MTHHVHLLLTPPETESVSRALQYIGRRYVPYINKTYGRTRTLWEGRFKASLVQEQGYVMAWYRYIEMNPVRAGMVESPGDYPWSSYQHNGEGVPSDWLAHHAQYESLAETVDQRCDAYRRLFDSHLDPDTLSDLRRCLQTGTPLGNDRFRERIEAALKVKVGYASRGRPRKADDVAEQGELAGQKSIKGL